MIVRAAALIAALALLLPLPSRAASNQPLILTGLFNQACATYVNCVPALPNAGGAVLAGTLVPPPAMVTVQISGTYSGTLQLEGSVDCQNYVAETVTPSSGGSAVSSFTTAGLWTGTVSGVTCLQVRASAWSSGSATVTLLIGSGLSASASGGGGAITAPLDGSGNVKTAVQNFPATQPISGSVTVTQSSGANLHVNCDVGCISPWASYSVPASSLCVSPAVCIVKSGAGTFAALINESTSAQPAGTCTVYDNASAASGKVLYTENSIGSGQVIHFTANGIAVTNGIVVQCAANPGGSGLLVLYE